MPYFLNITLEFLISNINFEKESESNQKVVVDNLSLIFIVVSIHRRPQAPIEAVFRQSAGYVYNSSYLDCICVLSFSKDLFTIFPVFFFTPVRREFGAVILVLQKQ